MVRVGGWWQSSAGRPQQRASPDRGNLQSASFRMPRKIRELIQDLKQAGFYEIPGGKGSYRKFTHPRYPGAVTLSGQLGDDARRYQEKEVRQAIDEVAE